MFSITLKGKADEKRPEFVKITMVFYKPGYNRVPKILPITGLLKNWDQETQRFDPKSQDAHSLNAMLSNSINKYSQIANAWELQGTKWTPKQLSHYFDKPREVMLRETVIPTVEQMFNEKIDELRATMKMKNGHEVSSEPYAKQHESLVKFLKRFTKEKYGKSFSNFYFTDITEQFLKDYVFFIESEGAKKGNKGSIRTKLHLLYKVVEKAEKRGVPGADKGNFACTNEKFREEETIPSTIPLWLMYGIESMDRSLLSEVEKFHIDLFLFCFYCGGMAPIDAAYLTWSCINMERRKITYERIKTPKKARPPFVPRAEKIAERYKEECYENFVLPIFTKVQQTETQKKSRMNYLCTEVNKTLRRVAKLLNYEGEITWYSARGTYITMMVDKNYPAGVVAEHSGNSVQTIYKFYWKNVNEADIIAELCKTFAA